MPVWLVHAVMSTARTQGFHLPVFPAMQNLPIMPVRLERIALVATTPATGQPPIPVHTPALRMRVGMVSITGIHPAALVIPLPLAALLVLPATMEMKAVKGMTAVMAMMIEVIG